MPRYTLGLDEVGRRDLALAGGKGASLGELTRAGFPVPTGFVVTTTAYTDFVAAAGLGDSDPERLRERIRREPVPEEIVASIVGAYRELGTPAVAVRSSGTAEDLADASFAGQHDTFLNVTGEQAVIAAVRDCWASLWTPRAVAYRQRYGWDERGLALAVVVQTMVDAEWAGVMFTADPVTGRRDRVVIEAVRGLGEALVSGQATGDRHIVDKGTGRLLTADSPLGPGVLEGLARLGARVEDAFGTPHDIEWTYAAGRRSLVQARPLTALPDEPRESGARRRQRRRQRGRGFQLAADHIPYPPYPMDWSLIVRPAMRAILDGLRAAGFATPHLEEVLVEIDEGVVQIAPWSIRSTPRAVIGVPAALPTLVATLRTRPADWLGRCHATLGQLTDRIDGEGLAGLSDRELIDRLEAVRRAQGQLVVSRFGCAVPGLLAGEALEVLLRVAVGPERGARLHADLMSAIPSVTRQANRELDRLAATIRETPELSQVYSDEEPEDIPARLRRFDAGRALLDDVAAYLRRYGYRQATIPLPGFRPLREAPERLHDLLKGLSRAKQARPGAEAGGESRVGRARRELTAGRDIGTRVLAPLALKLAGAARTGVGVREDSHFYLFMVPAAVQRRLLLELGRRLVERGLLTDAADVFFLEMDEVREPRSRQVREVAARRKAAREAAVDHYTVVPAELLRQDSGTTAVQGVPASRGTAVGSVRVVRDESEFAKLAGGEILVCPYTNPTWTPLFSLASAVVADTGGAASHAAIVAREHGIPAVMGTFDGTRLLVDGQRVLVDGDNGTVVVVGEGAGDGDASRPGPRSASLEAP